MNYQLHYDRLITRARLRPKPEGYTERHHIIPSALGGTDEINNLVTLMLREHYVAHLLLAKIHGGSMWRAFYMMSCRLSRKSSRLYQTSRLNISVSLSIVGKRVGYSNYSKGIGLAAISKEDRIKWAGIGGKLGGLIGGKMGNVEGKRRSGLECRDLKKGFHNPEVQRKGAAIAGNIAKESGQIYELQRQVAAIGGSASCKKRNLTRVVCVDCGLSTNPGAMGIHKKYSGHKGNKSES